MARTDSLTNFLTDVSTAIKTKKGDNTPIKASNFDTEIANLPTGSGGVDISEYMDDKYTSNASYLSSVGYWTKLIKKLPPITELPTNCQYFFSRYPGTKLDLSKLSKDVKPTNVSYMFQYVTCEEIDVSNLNLNEATNVIYLFAETTSKIIKLGNNTLPKATSFNNMFRLNQQAKNLPHRNLDYSNVTELLQFLYSCINLEDDIEINAPVCTNFSNCNYNCRKVQNIKLSSNVVTNLNNLCYGCSVLKTLDLSGMNLSGITGASTSYSVAGFVHNCSKLENLTFGTNYGSGFGTSLSANNNNASLNLSTCSSLTKASVLDLFNKLSDITGKNTQKITLHANVKALLTDEEIATVTSKNWTVV